MAAEMHSEDPAVQGWQAAIELDESRLSTSALHRRMSTEMARVQPRLSEALSACSEMGMAYATVALDNSRLRRELAGARHDAEHCAAERDGVRLELVRMVGENEDLRAENAMLRAQLKDGA